MLKDRSALNMVQQRKQIAENGRDEYDQMAIENEKLYRNYIDETTHPYLSNISLPWSYIIVESYLGKTIQMLAAQLPYVRVVEEDDDSRPKAKRVEKDANMCLYLQKWPILAYKTYKQAFKLPCGWLQMKPWGYVAGREMPIFLCPNWYHIWINPTILDLDDEDAYLIHENYVPANTLKQLKDNPNYRNINRIQVHEGTIYTDEEEEIRAFKELPGMQNDPYSNLVKVWTYWDHEQVIIVTNEDNIIRNSENFLEGMIPYKKITPIPLEDEFYGMSILEEGRNLFVEANENRNQYNDAVSLMLNPQWIISRGCHIKKTTIVSRTGSILFTDDVSGVKQLPIDWNILPQSLARGSMIEKNIMDYSNAFPQMRGAPVAGAQETATEYLGMRSAGELRSDTYNLLLAMMSIEDIVHDVVRMKRMFMTEPSNFFYWPEMKTQTANPEDYSGSFTFKAYAQYKQSREIERKQLIEAMTLIFGNQAFLPLVMPRVDEWLDRLLDQFSLRSPEQLWASPQEMMIEQMKQMMFGGMPGMPMPGGQGQTPALGEKAMRMPETSPNVGTAPMIGNMNQ